MNPREPSDSLNAAPVPGKKTWTAPEIRDQSIKSLTETKSTYFEAETTADLGPS